VKSEGPLHHGQRVIFSSLQVSPNLVGGRLGPSFVDNRIKTAVAADQRKPPPKAQEKLKNQDKRRPESRCDPAQPTKEEELKAHDWDGQ
jgi:hypothetical protein